MLKRVVTLECKSRIIAFFTENLLIIVQFIITSILIIFNSKGMVSIIKL